MHFYFVGIKGTGMSALANILVDLGYEVSGVDYNKKYFTEATFSQSIVVENFDNYHLDEKYFYIIGNERKNRFGFRKDILISKYGCDPNDTEHNFCFNKGWYRIYDCGTKVYKWKSTH